MCHLHPQEQVVHYSDHGLNNRPFADRTHFCHSNTRQSPLYQLSKQIFIQSKFIFTNSFTVHKAYSLKLHFYALNASHIKITFFFQNSFLNNKKAESCCKHWVVIYTLGKKMFALSFNKKLDQKLHKI